jgi:hypothetical protein
VCMSRNGRKDVLTVKRLDGKGELRIGGQKKCIFGVFAKKDRIIMVLIR